MGVLPQSIRGNERNVDGLFALGGFDEVAATTAELRFLIFSDGVLLRGEFHLA